MCSVTSSFGAFESHIPRGPRTSRLTAESTALYQGPTRGARYGTQIPATVRCVRDTGARRGRRSEEHTSELQSQSNLVCRLLLEKKKTRAHHCPSHPSCGLTTTST